MKAILCSALLVLIPAAMIRAQKSSIELDQLFTALYKNGQFNGNVLVAEGGNVLYQKSFGYADFKAKKPNQTNTAFPIASITKSFTATAILQLAQKGVLDINAPVVRYLPEFPYPEITIRHLLSHTSGLQPYDNVFDSIQKARPGIIFTNSDVLPAYSTARLPLFYQPGAASNYDNANYIFLAVLIEKVSRMPYRNYISKHIFRPAEMYNTFFPQAIFYHYTPAERRKIANTYWYPHFYESVLEQTDTVQFIAKYWGTYLFQGFGDIISTTDDLLKYDQALYAGKLLKNELLQTAFTPVSLNSGEPNAGNNNGTAFGLGWIIERDSSLGKIVRSSGGLIGLRASLVRNLSTRQTIILVDNTGNETDDLAKEVTKLLHGQPVQPRRRSIAREFGQVLVTKGIDSAKATLQALKSDTLNYALSEDEMNSLGYDLMGSQKLPEAVETFKTNTELFPKSWNVYDSYGEALLHTGQKDAAIKMYRKSIALNPGNENGKKVLEQLGGQ